LPFEKREIVLILGILFLMIGMMPFIAPIYAVTIAIVIYFGVRVFVGRRKKQIRESIGEGVCLVCGQKIIKNKCPNCDNSDNSQLQEK
jgi:phosphate/sulfate permease